MHDYEGELKLIEGFLLKNPRGLTVCEISKKLNINRNSVAKYLDVLETSGHAEMRVIGPAKVFFLSHRVPLSAMLNFSSDCIIVLDEDLMVLQVNEKLLDLMNAKKEALLGKSIKESPHKIFTDNRVVSGIKNAFEGKDSSMDIYFKENHNELHFWVKIIPTRFEDGGKGATMILENITERKKAERDLVMKNKAIESSISGIGMTDLNGKIIYVNDACAKMWGYKKKNEIIGRHLPEFWHGKRVFQTLKSLKEKGFDSGEDIGKRKDGSMFNVLFTANVVNDETGKPVAMLGSFMDITKQKKAEREIKIKDKAIESAINAIAFSDLKGNLTYVNDSFLKMWGYNSKKEVLGKPAVKFWKIEREAERIIKQMQAKVGWVGELTAKKKNGSLFDVQLSASMTKDDSGRPICIMSSFIDISRRRKAEKDLQKGEKKYRILFDLAPVGIGISDPEGNVLAANRCMQDVTGYTVKELKKINIGSTYLDPNERKQLLKILNKSGRVHEFKARLKRKDGKVYTALLNIDSVELDGKKAFLTTVRDISNKK